MALTGIALFVTSGNKPYLRYVFEVADTGIRRSSPELKAWEVTAENRDFLMAAMERSFGVKADGLLEAQLEDVAMTLATGVLGRSSKALPRHRCE